MLKLNTAVRQLDPANGRDEMIPEPETPIAHELIAGAQYRQLAF